MSQRKIAVAIDGPAGAGKSTIARAVAAELGFIYVDTGALYRAVGLYGLRKNADTASADQMLPLLEEIKVELAYVEGEQRVLLNGEDVSQAIRVNEASMAASNVSAIPGVRSFLFDLQKNMAKTHNVVMDGRDIGTVVLPEAQVKIFLTATPEERATRRYNELLEKGQKVDFDQLLAEVKQRDYNDSHRATAPLKQAEDAVLVDTTGLDIEQSIEKILDLVRSKL
ncbi:MAG: (d)CMP kinase [Oscillospiraceae bacterium]|nr:(d)CMP kinase [Oscillospiraceae bacterium]